MRMPGRMPATPAPAAFFISAFQLFSFFLRPSPGHHKRQNNNKTSPKIDHEKRIRQPPKHAPHLIGLLDKDEFQPVWKAAGKGPTAPWRRLKAIF
jgi:hypothetical protein